MSDPENLPSGEIVVDPFDVDETNAIEQAVLADLDEEAGLTTIGFSVAGRDFTAVPYLEPATLLTYSEANVAATEVGGAEPIGCALAFIELALGPASWAAFDDLFETGTIRLDVLSELVIWLYARYTERVQAAAARAMALNAIQGIVDHADEW